MIKSQYCRVDGPRFTLSFSQNTFFPTLLLQELLFPKPLSVAPSMEASTVGRPTRKRGPPQRLQVSPHEIKRRKEKPPDDNRCALESRPPNFPHTSPVDESVAMLQDAGNLRARMP